MGSGKTVVGAIVAQRTHATFHDLDTMVEDEAGMAVSDIFATQGESAFRDLESKVLPRALEPGAVLALGGGTPLDEKNWRLISGRAMTVYLEASFEQIWKRIGHLRDRPLASARSRDALESLLSERRPRYERADHTVDADQAAGAVADEVMKLWSA